MDELTKLAALIAPSLALLAFVSDAARRTRAAMRETLDLADQFGHDPATAARLRARASAIATEYLDEAERPPYPMRLTLLAWVVAVATLEVAVLADWMPAPRSSAADLGYGSLLAVLAIAFRRPIDDGTRWVRHLVNQRRTPTSRPHASESTAS